MIRRLLRSTRTDRLLPYTTRFRSYKTFRIRPAAQPQGGQWLTAGVIRKEIDGETREHRFVRADTHASAQSANDFAVVKGRQIVDEQGDRKSTRLNSSH